MRKLEKYCGIIPAFYACYDRENRISAERTQLFARYLVDKGVHGLYVGGSSGECIYLSKEERMRSLEAVMQEVRGECTVIAHVGGNNTDESMQLAAHAESLGVDAIASIPPIYYHLPEYAITKYWNDISSAAPNTDFVIYNIPQLAGAPLTLPMLREMKKNPCVIGVKNSSMPVQDIQMFLQELGDDGIVFNGPDEQLVSGLAIGAQGGIGGTYGAMPELYLKIYALMQENKVAQAREIQNAADSIIYKIFTCKGNMYAVIKQILRINEKIDIGSVRSPLPDIMQEDLPIIETCAEMIRLAIAKYC